MVEPESIDRPEHTGNAFIVRAERQASGIWGVDVNLSFTVHLDDGRQIVIDRIVRVRAAQQIGRKASSGQFRKGAA